MQPVSINGIEFDALMTEERVLEADVPEYPVEAGYSVSDNISRKPMVVSFKLYITRTPVTWLGRHGTGQGASEQHMQRTGAAVLDRGTVYSCHR